MYKIGNSAGIKLLGKHPNLTAHSFMGKIRGLPRARASLLFQLTTGHAPLQSHLFRLQVVDTRVCPHCGDAPETVAHILLRCHTFAAERHTHLTSNGLEFLNLSFLLQRRSRSPPSSVISDQRAVSPALLHSIFTLVSLVVLCL